MLSKINKAEKIENKETSNKSVTSYISEEMKNIEFYQINSLKKLLKKNFYSEMTFSDQSFLNGVVRKLKPKKN